MGDGVPVSPRSPSTASSASRPPSATPPPILSPAFLRFFWRDRYAAYEGLFTCDLVSARADPTNIRLRLLSKTFMEEPDAIDVYFEGLGHDEHVVVDDNGNCMLIGHIGFDVRGCW